MYSENGKYNPFLVNCRKLAHGTVSLTGDRAQGDDSKHDSHYKRVIVGTLNTKTNSCVTLVLTEKACSSAQKTKMTPCFENK